MKSFIPSKDNVKMLGRTVLLKDFLLLAYSGSGFEFSFKGSKAVITVLGDSSVAPDNEINMARFAVYVNGERTIDCMMDEKEKKVCIETDGDDTVVRFIKLSETAMSVIGVKSIETDAEDGIHPTEKKAHFIEFVGDSITCGYGVDDECAEHNFKTGTEDVTKAYAYRTAAKLDADYSCVSISGYGIITGYTDNDITHPEQRLPLFYDKLGFSYCNLDGVTPSDIEWNFSDYKPEVVLINLGTNDDSYTKDFADRQQIYQDEYVVFLKHVRKMNPDAKIVCALGIMGDRLLPRVEAAVDVYSKETGDTNITTVGFTPQNPEDGYAADWHPTFVTHGKAADKLTAELKKIMNW